MSLPEEEVEMALFARAKTYTTLPLFFPNYEVIPPADGSGYVEVRHFRNDSRSITLAHADFFIGILQMLVCLPRGKGPNEARLRGGEIAALFPKNLVLYQGTTRVVIPKRPVLGTAAPSDVKFELPVSIHYETSF